MCAKNGVREWKPPEPRFFLKGPFTSVLLLYIDLWQIMPYE